MRILLLAFLAVGFGQQNQQQQCFPPSCKIDANCVDSIHNLGAAKCCGGVCKLVSSLPSNRGVGESCMAASPSGSDNYYESCGGECGIGLYCSETDAKCHVRHSHGCNCTSNSECAENRCRLPNVTGASQTLCSAVNSLPTGASCDASDQCQTAKCDGGRCVALNPGDRCSLSFPNACGTNAYCRYNTTTFPYEYQCFTRCAAGVANCCSSFNDCQAGMTCNSVNGTCYVPTPSYAELGEDCTSRTCRNYTTQVCAYSCNSTDPCTFPSICQLRNQLPVGSYCYQDGQCALNSSCISNGTAYFCVAHRTVPTGQPCSSSLMCATAGNICANNGTQYVCQPNGTVPLGQPCYNNLALCAPPATYCGLNGTSTQVCRANGTVAIGEFCNNFQTPSDCVSGSQCVYEGPSYVCRRQKEVGENCTSFETISCRLGANTCVKRQFNLSGTCSTPGNCFCVTPKVVPDGQACNASIQCQSNFSSCLEGVCTPVAGQDCNSPSACGSGLPTFDCSCDRKCYILNNPTPAPTPYPTAPPSPPTPGFCDAKRDAWLKNEPVGWTWPYSSGYVFSSNFQCPSCDSGYDFVERARVLNVSAQAALIDYVCCRSCGGTSGRFYSKLQGGYQVDCNAKTLTKLADTCNSLRNSPAFLGCWTATVSSATTSTLGLGALIFAALLMHY